MSRWPDGFDLHRLSWRLESDPQESLAAGADDPAFDWRIGLDAQLHATLRTTKPGPGCRHLGLLSPQGEDWTLLLLGHDPGCDHHLAVGFINPQAQLSIFEIFFEYNR